MPDIFEAYKQQKMKKNIVIVTSALVFALMVNFVLIGTNVWQKLTASVTNFQTEKTVVVNKDISLVAERPDTNLLSLELNTNLSAVTEMRVSFLYDTSTLTLKDFFSENKSVEIIKMTNESGIVTLNLHYKEPQNFSANTKLLSIVYERKVSDKKTVVNLAETSFVTKEGTYELKSVPLEF